MFSGPIGAVLVDVGGTLWPNTWPLTSEVRDRRVDPVALALGVPRASAAEILSAIIDEGADEGMGVPIEEPVDELIARVLARRGLRADAPAVRSLRHALCLNLGQLVTPFPFAGDLLRGIKRLGARCVIVSNTTYRIDKLFLCEDGAEIYEPSGSSASSAFLVRRLDGLGCDRVGVVSELGEWLGHPFMMPASTLDGSVPHGAALARPVGT